MGQARRRGAGATGALGIAALALFVALTALSGCGKTADQGASGGSTATPPPAAPTTTPFPTATGSPQQLTLQPGCPAAPMQDQPAYVTAGGLAVSAPRRALDFPSELLPASVLNTLAAPYHLATTAVTHYAPNPPVNPQMPPGYFIQICNKSSATRTLTGMRVTIASFSARGGNVAIWHMCEAGAYDAATKGMTSGCGGASGGPLLTATMGRVAVGASAAVTGAVWPQPLAPGQSASLFVSVNGLKSQGMYTLRFTVNVAGGAAITVACVVIAFALGRSGPIRVAPAPTGTGGPAAGHDLSQAGPSAVLSARSA